MRPYKFNAGDMVYDKLHNRTATVIDNYGNPLEGNRGEIRLDTDGNVPIFEYDADGNRIAYNLIKDRIRSISVGWGEGSSFWCIGTEPYDCGIDEIIEEIKAIGNGYYNDLTIIVYRGYKDEKLVFEVEAGKGISIIYI